MIKGFIMEITIEDLSETNFNDHPCFKYCKTTERTIAITKNWLRKIYSIFGPCVKVAYIDGEPVAMVQYAPMDIFPHVENSDAHKTIVIHCIFVPDKRYEAKGIGRRLTETLIQDLKKPHPYLDDGRFEKIVAVAGKGRHGPAGPVEFFYKMGFTSVKQLDQNDVLVEFRLKP